MSCSDGGGCPGSAGRVAPDARHLGVAHCSQPRFRWTGSQGARPSIKSRSRTGLSDHDKQELKSRSTEVLFFQQNRALFKNEIFVLEKQNTYTWFKGFKLFQCTWTESMFSFNVKSLQFPGLWSPWPEQEPQ